LKSQHLLHLPEFRDQETIHFHQIREWEFQDQWPDLATIRSRQLKACRDQDLLVKDQIALAVGRRPAVPRGDQDLRKELVAAHPVDSFQAESPELFHRVQDLVVEAEEALARPVRLVAAVLKTSPESQSAKSEKSLN